MNCCLLRGILIDFLIGALTRMREFLEEMWRIESVWQTRKIDAVDSRGCEIHVRKSFNIEKRESRDST